MQTDLEINMDSMFEGAGVDLINLNNWNVTKVSNYNEMFASSSVEEITLNGWTVIDAIEGR